MEPEGLLLHYLEPATRPPSSIYFLKLCSIKYTLRLFSFLSLILYGRDTYTRSTYRVRVP
jgi:hypothetical protein